MIGVGRVTKTSPDALHGADEKSTTSPPSHSVYHFNVYLSLLLQFVLKL